MSHITTAQPTAESVLGDALQDVWNDHCQDTNSHPDCVALHRAAKRTTVEGLFSESQFVDRVVALMGARGFEIRQTEEAR